jgi:hypothetical protein
VSIEDEARAAARAVRAAEQRLLHHGQPQPAFTPRQPAIVTQQSQPSQQEVQPMSIGQTIHQDLSTAGAAIQHAWQFTVQVATNPEVDELVEVALTAIGAGVEAAAFAAATDALKGAIARKQGTVSQVAEAADAGQQAAQQGGQPPASPRTVVV